MRYRHKDIEREIISKKEAFDLLKEFKKFAFRGSFLDLSVGVIIGGSFNKIVSSLVDNIIMPVVGLLLPFDSSYKSWKIVCYGHEISVGAFIGDVVTFLIVSVCLFILMQKLLYWFFKEEKKDQLSIEQKTLLEIKDLLVTLANKHS